MVKEAKLEGKLIDCDGLLPRVVLETAGHEGLREEESAHPESLRSSVSDPFIEELYPCDQVLDPTAKRLQTEKSLIRP